VVVQLWIRVGDLSVNIVRCCRDHFSPPGLFEPSLANNLISVAAVGASSTREPIG
jgi:hypothetical protein